MKSLQDMDRHGFLGRLGAGLDGALLLTCLLTCLLGPSSLAQAQEESDEVPRPKRTLRPPRALRTGGPSALAAPPPPAPAAAPAQGGGAAALGAPPPAVGAQAQAASGGQGELPLPGEKEFTECKRIPAGKKVVVTLKPDSELNDLIGWIKGISCRPFIVPAGIRQSKVTIIVPEAITAAEAYRIFLSALESMGLTVQPDGRALKIIEANRARESSIPVITPGRDVPGTEQYVTRMLRLNYVFPEEVVNVLGRLKGRDGDITPYAPTNTLIITDLATNIKRMEEVVRALDVPMGGEKIWVIRLKNVVAGEVAQMLQQVFGVGKSGPGTSTPRRIPPVIPQANPDGSGLGTGASGAAGASGGGSADTESISQIFPDDRTNSLILVATEKTYQRVMALVRRLEAQGGELGSGGGRVHVYSLENAKAEDLSNVLQGIGVSVAGGGGRRGGRAAPASGQAPQPGQGGGGMFQDEVRVTPDPATNSLVILANAKDYLAVRDLIQRLDQPRRQVFIEAMVMEVSLSKSRDLGLSYHGGYQAGDGANAPLLIGGLKNGSLNSLSPLSAISLAGLAAGAFGPPITNSALFGQANSGVPSFGVLMQALQTNNDVNILQNPTLLTTDNEKATIQVGQNLPFPGAVPLGGGGIGGLPGAGGGIGGLGFFSPPVQRQDVALKLEITPHINASEMVRLEIDNEISDVADRNYNGLGPATNKRTLKTVAVVRDQQPVVLGGILRDRIAESVTKIPLLGDIPILGYLFKLKNQEVQKQMLLVVLTPYVIRDSSDLRRIFERKMKERREFIETYSAFANERDFDAVVDYSRKRGALEEINRTATEAEREANDIRAAEAGLRREVEGSPVELPPQRSGGGGGGGGGGAPVSPSAQPPPAITVPPSKLIAPPPPAPGR